MNCHLVAGAGKPNIEKLKQYYNEKKPIEWIRIHELPDHTRFVHKSHVNKGLDCVTCHGDVKSMDKVVQVSPLTMGWCLDCHRNRNAPASALKVLRPDQKTPSNEADPLAPFNCATCHH